MTEAGLQSGRFPLNEQAALLRQLSRSREEDARFCCPFLVVTGGKGGVGKTTVAANLAVALGAAGRKILLADLDLGLANLDVFLRVFPRYTLSAVASGERTARECLVQGPQGVSLLPGPNGIAEMASLGAESRARVVRSLASASAGFDLVVADTAAGIAADVLSFAAAADRVLLVTTPEPAALTDVYSLYKILASRNPELRSAFVVNNAASAEEAAQASQKLRIVAERFLGRAPEDLGWLPRDAAVPRASREQRPFVAAYPDSLAAGAARHLARRVIGDTMPHRVP